MFWKFSFFEMKLLLKNRKNWFIAAFLLLFFTLFFIYYSQDTPEELVDRKRNESQITYMAFEYLNLLYQDVPEIAAVREHHVEVQNLVNMQVWHIGEGDDSEQYIEDGLTINEHRLAMHDLGNEGIPEHLIIPREEILKEDALLHYIRDNDLPIASDSFSTNHHVTNVLGMFSGLLFLVILLISGNELLIYERRHLSVMRGFPLPFIQKIISKVSLYSIFIFVSLVLGFGLSNIYLSSQLEAGEFSYPILIYQNENYIAVSTLQYIMYIFLGFALITVLLLTFSILLNMIFKNAFANILVGLGIFLLPDLAVAAGLNTALLHPIKFIDIFNVLSGDLAMNLNNPAIDYWFAMAVLAILTIVLIGVIYAMNKSTYKRVPKDRPLENAY